MVEPKCYRYTRAALVKDYLLGVAGLLLGGLPFFLAAPGQVASVILAVILLLSGFLLLRAARRHAAVIRLDSDAVSYGGRILPWGDLRGLRLRHFATQRDQADGGWMELRLLGPGRRITIDSGLKGFSEILRAAHGAALANHLTFDPVTAANLGALGLEVPLENI